MNLYASGEWIAAFSDQNLTVDEEKLSDDYLASLLTEDLSDDNDVGDATGLADMA
jgi:hypothetical protein